MAELIDFGIRIYADVKDAIFNLDNARTAIQAIVPSVGLIGFANDVIQTSDDLVLFGSVIDQVKQKFAEFLPEFDDLSNRALKLSTAFGEAQGKVATLYNNSSEFADATRALSQELNGQISSTDLLNAGYETLSSGVVGVAGNMEVLKASVLGAKGGFTDVKTVADATTTIMNAYGKSAEDASKIVDQFIATQNAGKIVVGEYASLVGDAATIAAQAGVSFEELSAFVATATASGVKAGVAITGLRQGIANILRPSSEAVQTAKQLGIQFDAQALKAKGLAEILAEIYAKSGDAVKFNQNLIYLFGSVEAVTSLLPSAGLGADNFAKNLDYVTNSSGLAADAAQKVADTFQGQVSKGFILAQELMVSFGKGVELVVKPIVQGSNAILAAINAIPEPVKQAFGAFAAAGGIVLGAILSIIPALGIAYLAQKAFAFISGISASSVTAFAAAIERTSVQIALMELQLAGVNVGTAAFANTTGLAGLKLIAMDTFITAFSAGMAGLPRILELIKVGLQAALKVFLDFAKFVVLEIGGMIAKFALFYAAIDAVSTALGTLASISFGSEGSKSLREMDGELKKIHESVYGVKIQSDNWLIDFGAGMDRGNSFTEKFIVLLVNTQAQLSKLFGKGELKDASDEFGADTANIGEGFVNITKNGLNAQGVMIGLATSFKFVSAAQRDATDQQLQLDESFSKLTGAKDIINTIQKYGLTIFDAGDKARLGAQGIAIVKEEILRNIEVANKEIEVLKSRQGLTKSAQAQVNAEISVLQSAIAQGRLRISQLNDQAKAETKVANSVEDLSKSYESDVKNLEFATNQKIILVKEQQAQGLITALEASNQIQKIESESFNERLAIAQKFQFGIKTLSYGASADDEKKLNDLKIKIETDTWKTREDIAKKGIDNIAKREKEALDNYDLINRKAEATLQQSQNVRTAIVEAALANREISEEQANVRRTQIAEDGANEEIKIVQEKILQLQQLEAQKIGDSKKNQADILTLQTQLSSANLKAIQAEASAQKALEQEKLKQIENIATAQKNALDRNVNGLQLEIAARERLSTILDAQKNLEEVRNNLTKANSDFAVQGIEQEIDKITYAADIKKQLDSGEVASIEVKTALENAYYQSGLTYLNTEQDFLAAKQQKEKELAQAKRKALTDEQAGQQLALQLDLLRNQAARERLDLESQINLIKAKQSEIDAQKGLAEALQSKDATRIDTAQTLLDLSQKNVDLANKEIETSQRANDYAKEADALQKQILDKQQQTALSAFDFSEKMRQSAASIDLAKASTDNLNSSLSKTASLADNVGDATQKMSQTFQTYQDAVQALKAPAGGTKINFLFDNPDPASNIQSVIDAQLKLQRAMGGFNFGLVTGQYERELRASLEKAYGLSAGSSILGSASLARVGAIPTRQLGGVGLAQAPSISAPTTTNTVNQTNTIQVIDSPDPYAEVTKTLVALGRI